MHHWLTSVGFPKQTLRELCVQVIYEDHTLREAMPGNHLRQSAREGGCSLTPLGVLQCKQHLRVSLLPLLSAPGQDLPILTPQDHQIRANPEECKFSDNASPNSPRLNLQRRYRNQLLEVGVGTHTPLKGDLRSLGKVL